ncbi:MAG: hypothetical protein HQ504_02010 [Rhodospirillaceae bacterium]|nr:hypothetical protein [Rhodospirillaceae bacterium]
MPRQRFIPRLQSRKQPLPFIDAEEAWFWYIRAQRARDEGIRFMADASDTMRPCDPDDLYRAVIGLAQRRVIDRRHLKVLASFGAQDRSPDARLPEQQQDRRLWDEAMDRLTTILKSKEIIL